MNDLDNEEAALHEFDFLSGDTTATDTTGGDGGGGEWNVDPTRINRLKEEYKRDRHAKQAHQASTITNTTSASIRNSLLNNGGDEISSEQQDEQSNAIDERPMIDEPN